jgi:hypothetical protein
VHRGEVLVIVLRSCTAILHTAILHTAILHTLTHSLLTHSLLHTLLMLSLLSLMQYFIPSLACTRSATFTVNSFVHNRARRTLRRYLHPAH